MGKQIQNHWRITRRVKTKQLIADPEYDEKEQMLCTPGFVNTENKEGDTLPGFVGEYSTVNMEQNETPKICPFFLGWIEAKLTGTIICAQTRGDIMNKQIKSIYRTNQALW